MKYAVEFKCRLGIREFDTLEAAKKYKARHGGSLAKISYDRYGRKIYNWIDNNGQVVHANLA